MAVWLGTVVLGTGIAGLRGRLPGCEPRPYIIRFTEDRPNPVYRRLCYTCAWSAVVSFGVLNLAGLVTAVVTGVWNVREMYEAAYFPLAGAVWVLGALGRLPRVKPSTKGRGARTSLLLRVGLGHVHRAAGALGALAGVAGRPGRGCREALRLRGHSRVRGMAGLSRKAAAYASDRPGRTGGLGLNSPWRMSPPAFERRCIPPVCALFRRCACAQTVMIGTPITPTPRNIGTCSQQQAPSSRLVRHGALQPAGALAALGARTPGRHGLKGSTAAASAVGGGPPGGATRGSTAGRRTQARVRTAT